MTDELKNVAELNAVVDVLATELPLLIGKLDEVLEKMKDNPDVSADIASAKDRIAGMAQTIKDKLNPPSPEESGGNVEGA